jgi:hypothetical protein
MLKLSTGLRNKLLDTGSLRGVFTNFILRLYDGTVPATADTAVAISPVWEATGLNFAATASSGAISKDANAWTANASQTKTVTFYRLVASTDTGALSTSEQRIQGEIGTAGKELNLTSTGLTSGNSYTIDTFSVGIPTL